jgi:outer membrane protein OmpA-like peptidoglycan-associated protein
MIRNRLLGPVSAVALLALAPSGAAQGVSTFGTGPDRVCNILVSKADKPVLKKGGAGSVLTARTYDCPERGLQPIAEIEPAAPAAEPLAGGVIYFELDRANLDSAGAASLAAAIDEIKGRPLGAITVAGHTDTSGAADYNQRLSQRRANTVATELIKAGVPAQLISAAGYGQTDLAVPTADGVALAANRRVVIDVAP